MIPPTTENRLASGRIRTPAGGFQLPDEVYNLRWMERVKALCVIDQNDCWLFQGHLRVNGYGDTNYRGKNVIVHRKMFEIANGVTLGRWEYACHTCDVRRCCNPAHLWKGTPLDNQVDSVMKRRNGEQQVTHCPRGHEYTPENINWKVAASGRPARECRACQLIKSRRRYWERRGLPREQALAKALGKSA